MHTLSLTSPLTRGDQVYDAQKKLIRAGFLRPDQADGVFGPETCRACRRAHYWLGFTGKLTYAETYGDQLAKLLGRFLAGRDLPPVYATRRARRLRAAKRKPMRVKALDWLGQHVGEKEQPPNSNRVAWASVWYGVIGPWCAMAVTRAYVEAGSKTFKQGARYAYVPFIVHDATHGLNQLARTFDPQPGDIVCFDWDGDGIHDHTGLVLEPPASLHAGAAFKTREGNTAVGNDSDGGEEMDRDRSVLAGNRTVFVRVGG